MKIGRLKRALAADTLRRQGHGGKIQNQAIRKPGGLEVASDDRKVNFLQRFDCFELDDNPILHKEIETMFTDLMISIE